MCMAKQFVETFYIITFNKKARESCRKAGDFHSFVDFVVISGILKK